MGIDAIALERDRFPRPKVCGGFISPGAVDCLGRLGLLDEILDAGAVEVTSARVRAGSAEVEILFERRGLGISRAVLDEVVARHARVKQGCGVHEVKRHGRLFHVNGMECSVVIDAAGKLSRFTKRRGTGDFGVQYVQPGTEGAVSPRPSRGSSAAASAPRASGSSRGGTARRARATSGAARP